MFVLGTLPQHTGWWIIECSCLFLLHCFMRNMGNLAMPPMRGEYSHNKIRLCITNKTLLHTYVHKHMQRDITHTHTHWPFFSQTKLVLINLAGGTRHVFPFTSWPAPRVAQWKPSILVCLQFVCLNFLLICIIHWWPVGLAQEVVSEDCRVIYFTQASYIMSSFSYT